MYINVAAMKSVKDVPAFFDAVKESFPEITAGVIAEGYGCLNFGFIIDAPDEMAEKFANQITMALMPARWSQCNGDPMLRPGEFYDARGEAQQ